MKKNTILLASLLAGLLLCDTASGQSLPTPYESGNGNQTTTYDDCIAWYRKLDKTYPQARLDSIGLTDIGRPLHLVILDTDEAFNPEAARKSGKNIVFILNGIHPGEPEGIDASMLLARNLLSNPAQKNWLRNTVVLIVPVFNVDGSLRRNSHSRANQNGPEAYGFRGNSRNLDLNRDFAKLDSKNARSLVNALRHWDPDLFLDTHTTNGADYQHVMTLIASQKDKMHPAVGHWMNRQFTPALYTAMAQKGYPMCPYVNTEHELPDSGLIGFLETPRYSTGYTALFHTAGYVLETHMLKAYEPRVKATLELLSLCVSKISAEGHILRQLRKEAKIASAKADWFALNWQVDRSQADTIDFQGFTPAYKTSQVHGENRLYYDRQQPWVRKLHYHNHYKSSDSVVKPMSYLIPQAWTEVIDRLDWNRIPYRRLTQDSTVTAEFYFITDYQSTRRPYEGHYLHYNIQTRVEKRTQTFRKGDVLVSTGTENDRFVVEMLEPRGVDSYFSWGFFDGVLQQKEYFSAYVFEDTAAELLRNDEDLRDRFEAWKSGQPTRPTPAAQLDWIYRNSVYYEGTAQMYPVAILR